jgi:hypothetical protein
LAVSQHYRASASAIPNQGRLAGSKDLVFGLQGHEVGGRHGLGDSLHAMEFRSERRLEENDS